MKGLSGQVKADMARILAEGMGRGKNPREIARDLTAQTGIEARRGHRIARTEVTTALEGLAGTRKTLPRPITASSQS